MEHNRILLTLAPLRPPLRLLLPSISQHTFKIKSGRGSNNPTGGSRLLHFPASLCSPNGTGLVIALLSFGGIPLSFFQCHASRLNSNLNAAPSHVFEISLTGYKEPKNCVVNRISWPCGWEGNLFMIRLIFRLLSASSLVSVCKVSAVILRVKPSISSKWNTFNQRGEAVSTEKWDAWWPGDGNIFVLQLIMEEKNTVKDKLMRNYKSLIHI